jgi:hypothetical protein
MALVRAAMRAGTRGAKAGEVSTILNFTGTFTTVAATDNTTVINLKPADSTEWASLANIWDEMIVDGGHFDFTVGITTNFTNYNGASRAVVCYDPLDSTALGSLSNGLQHQQHFQFGTPNTTAGTNILPVCVTKCYRNAQGVYRFMWKTPRAGARQASAAANFGHEWSSTNDTGDFYGFLKFYIPQSGATGLLTVYWTWTLNTRWRCRT